MVLRSGQALAEKGVGYAMQTPDLQLLSTVQQTHIAPCSHCRQSFDLVSAAPMSDLYRGTAYRNEAFREFHVDEYLAKPVNPRLMPAVVRAHSHSNDVRSAS